jgi:hypothetical protein
MSYDPAYYKAWYARNREALLARRKAQYAPKLKKPKKPKQTEAERRAKAKAWRDLNPAKERARRIAWRAANREKDRARKREWYARNSEKNKAAARARSSNKKLRTIESVNRLRPLS